MQNFQRKSHIQTKETITRRSKINWRIKTSPWSHTREPFLSLLSWIRSPLSQVQRPLLSGTSLDFSPLSLLSFSFWSFLPSFLLAASPFLSAFCPIWPPSPASPITSHGRPKQPHFPGGQKKYIYKKTNQLSLMGGLQHSIY